MSLSTFLNGRAPTTLRGLSFLALSDTGYVLRLGGTAGDSGGGSHQTWGTAGTVACRVAPMGARTGEVANQIDERSTHVIYLPPDTDATEVDRFEVGSTLFEITAVRTRTAEPIRELEAIQA